MSQIAYSSIPVWARSSVPADDSPADDPLPALSGRSYLLVGVGEGADDTLRRWTEVLPGGTACRVLSYPDTDRAGAALRAELAEARVGVRLVIAAPTGASLALRGVAVTAGLNDDEIHVASTGSGDIDVLCPHCRTVTTTSAGVDDVIDCRGCGRHLLIYYHVSRRSGTYLGFMVDAETATPADASAGGVHQ
ncbi:dimethylamine monooxygenase subunit DmmA family protein [Gordonia rhizosphera]|uniref:Dimethylamine monooxygenase subunit DmmA-like C-terminal domain-containing protein n=1 Tax=Gordonia rhizosphera NBRC 16068 TaxID=1108045 RepID=K6WFR6_9ACTN|nr:dimethylamine monooxygenase subunit DmmA family protein [Gordonia rhizosphera]GAB92616.1 hypothetical protein GORHZ_185_00320 [Gordonia rhizosphera NBRC 16068]